jgi:hypothetical protein
VFTEPLPRNDNGDKYVRIDSKGSTIPAFRDEAGDAQTDTDSKIIS